MTTTIATYALPAGTAEGEDVIRRGVVFKAGEYKDKGITITADDLAAAVAAFSPVANDLEHRNTILSGHLGTLTEISVAEDGATLMGSVSIPKWLHDTMGDAPIKTSLAWDRATKKIVGNGLVLSPRVPDAALFSAYAEFAGARHSRDDLSLIDQISGLLKQLRDAEVAEDNEEATEGETTMSKETDMDDAKKIGVFDTLKALFTGEGNTPPPVVPVVIVPARVEEEQPVSTTTPAPFTETPEYKAMAAKLEAMEARFSTSIEAGTQTRAQQYADGAINANRAYPAQRESLTALFAQAIRDDVANVATITFGAGDADKGGRLDALVALVKATPAHMLTTETVPENITALFGASGATPAKDDPTKEAREWAEKANGTRR